MSIPSFVGVQYRWNHCRLLARAARLRRTALKSAFEERREAYLKQEIK